jgi:hypothetical protein
VSDLVENRKTGSSPLLSAFFFSLTPFHAGLLLNMNDLLPAKSLSTYSPPPCPSSFTDDSIPNDPHSLMNLKSPTFPLAVSLYRSLIVEAATNSLLRRDMAVAAHETSRKRSWFGAMEKLVDGFRDVVAAREEKARRASLELSRTSTIDLDVVCDSQPQVVEGEKVEAASTGATTAKRTRLLRLNGVLRRTGGRLRDSSVSLQPLRSWLVAQNEVEEFNGNALSTKGDGESSTLAGALQSVSSHSKSC